MLVLVIVLLVVGIRELSRDNLVVESIRIPKELSERGYTPEIVTERLIHAVLAMVAEGEEVAPQEQQDQVGSYQGLDSLTPRFQETDIPIPAVGMSLMSLVRFAKDFLRLPQRVVRGEIIQTPEGFELKLRFVSSGRSAVAHSGDVESLLEGGAKELIENTHPYELADYHYRRGDWEKAVEYIRHCLDRPDEDDPWALTLWGQILQEQGKTDDAIERYRAAIARDRNFAPAYREWGRALHRQGDYDGAIEKYREAVEIDNRYDRAHLNWGIALEKQRYPARAMEKYQEAAEVNPKYKWARNNWGYMLYLLGDDSGAMEQYREALAIDPKLTHSLGNWRISLQRYVDHEEGIGQFKTAAEVAGTHYATNEWGRLFLNLERYDDAIDVFRQIAVEDPNYKYAFHNWGLALYRKGDYQGAIDLYRKALSIDPKLTLTLRNWAGALQAQPDYDDGLSEFLIAVEAAGTADATNALGQFYFTVARYNDAIETFREIVEAHPDHIRARTNWGRALYMTRDDSGAITKYAEALALDPRYAYALESWRKALAVQADYQEGLPRFLSAVDAAGTPHAKDVGGRLLVDLGHYDEAIVVFNQLVQEYPKYKNSYCYWGVALRRKGDDTGAIEKYMEALDVDPTCSQAIDRWRTILRGAPAYGSSVARFKNAAHVAMTVDAMHALGVFHTEAKQYADAIGVFSQLAEKHPHDKRAFSSWGQVLQYDDEKFPSALEKYRRALELDPNFYSALSNWRRWLLARGNKLAEKEFMEAQKEFMEAVQAAGTAHARNELGLFYVDVAEYDDAIEVFRQIADHYPHYKYAYYDWGLTLQRQGEYRDASEKYRQMVAIDRDYPDAYLAWGDALSAQDRDPEAIEKYEEAARVYRGAPRAREALDKIEKLKTKPPTE